jgi:hypothetical protein
MRRCFASSASGTPAPERPGPVGITCWRVPAQHGQAPTDWGSIVDSEQQQQFAEQPEVLLDPGEYTLRIEEVLVAPDHLSIRALCMVVGGDSDGKKVCPEAYDFREGGENADAIRNLYGWGVSKQELMSTGGDVPSIGALLEGRLGRVSLQQREVKTGEMVNTHEPGAIESVEQ